AGFRAIFDPILAALAEVHANGILHRDIKPANIYVRADGSPVLLDFGNSREAGTKARSLTVALTPGYAPTEQYSSRGKQGPWTDIYSLGATMYMAITGERPPEAPDRVLDDDYVRVGDADKNIAKNFAAPLLEAVDQALALRPEDRPQDIAELQELLEGRSKGPITILPAGVGTHGDDAKTPRSSSRREVGRDAPRGPLKRRLAIAAVVAAVLVGGGAFGWMKYQEAEATRLAAEAEKARLAAVETARLEAERRREAARFERAAIEAAERAAEEARRAAWLSEQRRQLEQRRKAEESRERTKKKPPRCRDVGGYEAYMKRTGKVCML
ncbi:MAG: AarF/UbiB family protein, partial [Alphaproteobacteria bacterium]|nr:AarF/UbiB family protein [Alphaproteobacteria bacterium]